MSQAAADPATAEGLRRAPLHELRWSVQGEDVIPLGVSKGDTLVGAGAYLRGLLLERPPTWANFWQSQNIVPDHPMAISYELRNVILSVDVPPTLVRWQKIVEPNLPWAEDHFLERVSGEPLNPPPSEAWWPHAVKGNAEHKEGEQFSHTYPERFWPKRAGEFTPVSEEGFPPILGIRYYYGDLLDVLNLLDKDPGTRQAYLPVWFPEDTGAVEGQRVPCTLGYHFLQRDDKLHCTYFIRSCDFVRHFQDDLYMAGRLVQWVSEQLGIAVVPGELVMHMDSLHVFQGDIDRWRNE